MYTLQDADRLAKMLTDAVATGSSKSTFSINDWISPSYDGPDLQWTIKKAILQISEEQLGKGAATADIHVQSK